MGIHSVLIFEAKVLRQEKHKDHVLAPETAGRVGVFHTEGWGSKNLLPLSPGVSRELCRDVPEYLGAFKKFVKKTLVFAESGPMTCSIINCTTFSEPVMLGLNPTPKTFVSMFQSQLQMTESRLRIYFLDIRRWRNI